MTRALGIAGLAAAALVIVFILTGTNALASPIGPIVLSDGFEAAFPGGWTVGDSDAAGTPAYWDKVAAGFGSEEAHGGSHMAYCAGVGYGGSASSPTYQNSMFATMSRTLYLTPYSSATLSFWYKMPSVERNVDYLTVVAGADEIWWSSEATPFWTHVTIPLNAYVGQNVTLTFLFDSDTSVVAEGAYLDDILVTGTPAKATVADAWWSAPLDFDGDGYASYGYLQWNPNVVGGVATLSVYEKIYYKRASSSTWTLLETGVPHTITGSSLADIQTFVVKDATVPSMAHDKYDFRIDIYRSVFTTPDNSRGPASDSDLNDRKLEKSAEEMDYLPNDSPRSGSVCPWGYGFDVKSSHWAAVALNPAPNDKNLVISPHCTLSSPSRLSNLTGAARDFLVVNGTIVHTCPYYARVQDGGAGAYWIEAENSPPTLPVNSTYSGRHITTDEVLDLYQVDLTAGHKYAVHVTQSSTSTANVAVFAFKPTRTTASRSQRDFYRNSAGVGKSENLTFKAKYTGRWAIVVTNENAGAGTYSIKVARLN